MDDLVQQSMARWPNVPAVYGWLRLDRRGRWMLVDRGRAGFDEAVHGAGSPITNAQIVDFIGRNYACDDQGRWYWQNGPQRVFVDLETAPLVLRVFGSGTQARLATHTGAAVRRVDAAWRSAGGDLILLTDLGPGAVHDLDLAALALEAADDDFAADDTPIGGTPADAPALRLVILGRRFTVRGPPASAEPFQRRPRG